MCVLTGLAALLSAPAAAWCGEADKPVEIEVLLFAGGEGMEFYLQCAREYEKLRPNVKVNLSGDPRMPDKVRIRILEGTYPEITNIPDGSASWNLIRGGFVQPMDEFLDAPAWDEDRTWRSSFMAGALDQYTDGGKVYGVPLTYWVWGIWYNKAMFEKHGWKPARTWDELYALCEQVKAAGIAPIAFMGRYPTYANSLLQSAYYHLAGAERFMAMLDVRQGSFDNPEFREAAALTQRLAVNYFQKGSSGMSHTEAQMQFFQGQAAMIVCASWLKSEMKGNIPPGFRLGTFNLPVVPGGKGDPTAVNAWNGYFWVMKHSRHPREAADFLRFMTSRKMAAEFCRQRDQPAAIRGASEGNLSSDLDGLVAMGKQAKSIYSYLPLRPEMDQHWADMITKLIINEERITPDDAAEMMERAAASVRSHGKHERLPCSPPRI
ncbi:MAG: extracellular solute-binding protein [Planctomycetota bacterium]|nr:extracellular solute-binding protein [Planctomycetota bacterium]